MIFTVGLVIMCAIILPAFIVGIAMFIARGYDVDIEDERRNCSDCNHCTFDIDGWYCDNEECIYYGEEADFDMDYCGDWESEDR